MSEDTPKHGMGDPDYENEDGEKKTLTTNSGEPVPDNQNSRSAGPEGPLLMEDYHYFEKMAQFNREEIPERIVHAKGGGAFGTFTVTNDEISDYTMADMFSEEGKETDLVVRFSTVAGSRGAPDTVRDPRGFAVKFYTEEGNWDMVGNNTPVFFIRDPSKFPDFIHTQKEVPGSGLNDPTPQWDFWSLSPESLHQITTLFSERGIPASWRHMNGYSSHTLSLYNDEGERYWVKFHFKTDQGIENLDPEKAKELAGENPHYHREDLWTAIEEGNYPTWTLKVQIMPEEEAEEYDINPFDLTRVWPHDDYPLIEVGTMELNENPDNFFQDVEESAFSPAHVVPGIAHSPDKMLQGRIPSYDDAHRYRLGANFEDIPVNQPKNAEKANYHQNGFMRSDGNNGAGPNYEPNSFGGPVEKPEVEQPPLNISGDADRYEMQERIDNYKQPGDMFRDVMSEEQRDHLMDNFADSMEPVDETIQRRQLAHFYKADPDWGRGVAERLDLDIEDAVDDELLEADDDEVAEAPVVAELLD
ncbi:catalase [Haladaptatus pallidirubidus]|uniref:Catalase KatA n=2 Tax=Haladaptatus pallidirubidus TaxID=1008152 RepID=A0AAV3UKU4_9EURY|nr:catalase [Haladaptatus pallidirubidus]